MHVTSHSLCPQQYPLQLKLIRKGSSITCNIFMLPITYLSHLMIKVCVNPIYNLLPSLSMFWVLGEIFLENERAEVLFFCFIFRLQ